MRRTTDCAAAVIYQPCNISINMNKKKRKVNSECHVFHKESTEKYFFVDIGQSKAACLICNETCAGSKNIIHGFMLSFEPPAQ